MWEVVIRKLSSARLTFSISFFNHVTFHLRLDRKCFIFPLLRDLVGLRVRGVKETIQGWARASEHDNLHLDSMYRAKQKAVIGCVKKRTQFPNS